MMNYDFRGVLIRLIIAVALIGWALIVGIIWLLKHLSAHVG